PATVRPRAATHRSARSTCDRSGLDVPDAGDRRDHLGVDRRAAVAAALDPAGQNVLGQFLLQRGDDVGLRLDLGHRLLDQGVQLAPVGPAGVAGDAVLGGGHAELPLRFLD
ncbi:MAG: hypothetical protein ACK56I_08930, partial [bacterium]